MKCSECEYSPMDYLGLDDDGGAIVECWGCPACDHEIRNVVWTPEDETLVKSKTEIEF